MHSCYWDIGAHDGHAFKHGSNDPAPNQLLSYPSDCRCSIILLPQLFSTKIPSHLQDCSSNIVPCHFSDMGWPSEVMPELITSATL
jgi:hypothetical protein